MKISVRQLRELFREGLVEEGKVSASPSYMKKEAVSVNLKQIISDHVASGEIVDQQSLEQFIKDMDVSLMALRAVPFDVWHKISSNK